PVVPAGRKREEIEATKHARQRERLRSILVASLALEPLIHEEKRPRRHGERGCRTPFVRGYPSAKVIEPTELVPCTSARLERPGEVRQDVQAEGGCRGVNRGQVRPGRRRGSA